MPRIGNEDGSVIIIVAAGLTFFLLMLGLVTDVGFVYLQRTKLANAVDAAALAGVQELPHQPDAAYAQAIAYGHANELELPEMSVAVVDQNTAVRVEARRRVGLFFLRLLGRSELEVQASAKARVGTAQAVRGAVPFSIEQRFFTESEFAYNKKYILKYDSWDRPQYLTGNFGALALGGKGANVYRNNIIHGYAGRIAIGDLLDTEPGNMAGPTSQGINERIRDCNECRWDDYELGCPRVVIVPIIDSLAVPGRKQVKVVGFAAFFIERVAGEKSAEVEGRFIEFVIDAEQSSGSGFGLTTYRLVE